MTEGYSAARDRWTTKAVEWSLYALAYGFERVTRRIDLWWLVRTAGAFASVLILVLPGPRRRIADNLALVYPDRPAAWRRRLMRDAADHFMRLMVEYTHFRRFVREARWELEGAEIIDHLRASDRGALIITAHYGNWEPVRLALKAGGVECGIIYRAFNNRYLDRYGADLIRAAGEPVMQKGPRGMRALLDHVSRGGTAMVLVDQRTTGAPLLPFLGQPAETLTVVAHLARRTGALVVPARGRRADGRGLFHVRIEEPVPPGDPEETMAEVNRRIGAWIAEDPAQWFWLHRRWRRGRVRD